MARTFIEQAEFLLSKKEYGKAKNLLEGKVIQYRESFHFFYLLGTACLYDRDYQGAKAYYQRAKAIKSRDPDLLLGMAALNLNRQNVPMALENYLEVLDYRPGDKTALKALNFLKKHGTQEELLHFVDSGRLKEFFPVLKFKFAVTSRPWFRVIVVLLLLSAIGGMVFFTGRMKVKEQLPPRADLESLELAFDGDNELFDSTGTFRYILTEEELEESYNLALKYFQEYRDNAAQVEINRILYSNAGYKVKKNARILMDYMEVPAFDTISDNYSLSQIQKEPYLYIDCYVQWKGTLANIKEYENLTTADLLVGYDTKHRVEGIVPMEIKAEALSIEIDPKLPVTVLGRVKIRDSRVSLDCVSLYQNIKSEI